MIRKRSSGKTMNKVPSGLHSSRLASSYGPTPEFHNHREAAFIAEWAREHTEASVGDLLAALFEVPCRDDDDGSKSLFDRAMASGRRFAKFPLGEVPTERDRIVAATVIQWLGTNCGMCFLGNALERCGYKIEKKPNKSA
jgi:hypothetical protein